MIYDLIVIGAGPAGSSAAGEAARRGLKVALLEKCRLPRHKTCGGGMPMTVGDELRDLAPSAFVESDVRYMRHTFNFTDSVLGEVNPAGCGREIVLWMVQRSVFDHELVRRAERLGASVWDDAPVEAISLEDNQVQVKVKRPGDRSQTLTADYVIGADGANGITAKAAGLRRERVLAVGMEVEHPHSWGDGHADLRPDVLHLDYGLIRNGYAWVFPKGDHLNVGAGLFRPRNGNSRREDSVKQELQRAIVGYLEYVGASYDHSGLRFHAHPLPLWDGKEPLNSTDGRILLAGDAAGMVNPLFGDGILHAVRSGIIAAECVADGRTLEYSSRIHAEIGPDFEAARRLAGPFYQFSRIFYKQIIRRPSATRAAARLLAGDALFTDAGKRAMRLIRRSVTPWQRMIAESDVSPA